MINTSKVPMWFIAVSVIAVLWNLMGLSVFLMSLNMTPEQIAELPERQQGYFGSDVPWWHWAAYGMAVVTGVLGSVLLLLKKKWATFIFGLSLIGILVLDIWTFVISDMSESMISEDYVMPTLVIIIGIALLFLSRRAERTGWIR